MGRRIHILTKPYTGRFAPSPTGYLHFGSLVAAVASFLDARAAAGRWLVRMEDLDAARVRPGSAESILRTLRVLGLLWDGEVVYQSRRVALYESAMAGLIRNGHVYECRCSRGAQHHGACPRRTGPLTWRVRAPEKMGDFVVKRADGGFAYQLAVVVDDAEQCITDVVRGADLLDSTPRQMLLQRMLGLPSPRYLHVPVALGADGKKLSKSQGAAALDAGHPERELTRALRFLGMQTKGETAAEILQDAVREWDRDAIRGDARPAASV